MIGVFSTKPDKVNSFAFVALPTELEIFHDGLVEVRNCCHFWLNLEQ